MTSLVGVDENLAASLLNISVLEKSSSDTGEKYIFMQRLRNFVKNICDFLQVIFYISIYDFFVVLIFLYRIGEYMKFEDVKFV